MPHSLLMAVHNWRSYTALKPLLQLHCKKQHTTCIASLQAASVVQVAMNRWLMYCFILSRLLTFLAHCASVSCIINEMKWNFMQKLQSCSNLVIRRFCSVVVYLLYCVYYLAFIVHVCSVYFLLPQCSVKIKISKNVKCHKYNKCYKYEKTLKCQQIWSDKMWKSNAVVN